MDKQTEARFRDIDRTITITQGQLNQITAANYWDGFECEYVISTKEMGRILNLEQFLIPNGDELVHALLIPLPEKTA